MFPAPDASSRDPRRFKLCASQKAASGQRQAHPSKRHRARYPTIPAAPDLVQRQLQTLVEVRRKSPHAEPLTGC
jgi:hypothetical protein